MAERAGAGDIPKDPTYAFSVSVFRGNKFPERKLPHREEVEKKKKMMMMKMMMIMKKKKYLIIRLIVTITTFSEYYDDNKTTKLTSQTITKPFCNTKTLPLGWIC